MGALENLDAKVEKLSSLVSELTDLLKLRRGGDAEAEFMTIASLAVQYDATPQTIRNWLNTMSAAGYEVKTFRNGAGGDWRVHAAQFRRGVDELFSAPFVKGV